MTFLCCFRSSVRPIDSADPSHLAPEDIEEKERQEVRPDACVCLVVCGFGTNKSGLTGARSPADSVSRDATRAPV